MSDMKSYSFHSVIVPTNFFYLIVPKEDWFGQPKYSTPSKKKLPTLYRSLLLYYIFICLTD